MISDADNLEITRDFTELTFYLPWKYKITNDSNYFDNLVSDGVYYNINNQPMSGSVHLALGAMHMIFMGVVYNYLIVLNNAFPSEFSLTLIGFHHVVKKEECNELSWHDFSLISERSILDFFRGVGMNKSNIGKIKEMVDRRNDLMHTNGVYIDDIEKFEEYSKKYLECSEMINQKCFNGVKKLFFDFVKSIKVQFNDDAEAMEYIAEYFSKEYGISPRALDLLKRIKIEEYPDNLNKKLIYDGLKRYSKEWDVEIDEYFVDSMRDELV